MLLPVATRGRTSLDVSLDFHRHHLLHHALWVNIIQTLDDTDATTGSCFDVGFHFHYITFLLWLGGESDLLIRVDAPRSCLDASFDLHPYHLPISRALWMNIPKTLVAFNAGTSRPRFDTCLHLHPYPPSQEGLALMAICCPARRHVCLGYPESRDNFDAGLHLCHITFLLLLGRETDALIRVDAPRPCFDACLDLHLYHLPSSWLCWPEER